MGSSILVGELAGEDQVYKFVEVYGGFTFTCYL